MAKYTTDHFILLLQNNYTREVTTVDVYNESTDPLFYEFKQLNLPDSIIPGEYTYALVWDILEYEVFPSTDFLETVIKVVDGHGETHELKLKDLQPEMGLLKFSNDNPYEPFVTINNIETEDDHYYSL